MYVRSKMHVVMFLAFASTALSVGDAAICSAALQRLALTHSNVTEG